MVIIGDKRFLVIYYRIDCSTYILGKVSRSENFEPSLVNKNV